MICPTKSTALVTHKGCLDGTGSALMFIWAGGRRDRILFKNPSSLILDERDIPDDVDEVWYADCCPPTLNNPSAGRRFKVFDHHISNEKRVGADFRCTFDMKKSGSSLMAHVLGLVSEDGPPWMEARRDLIMALEAYDLGRFDYVPGQRLADIAATYSQDEMLDLMIQLGPYDILHDPYLDSRASAMAAVRNLYADSAARAAFYTHMDIPDTFGIEWATKESDIRIRIGVSSSPVYWKNDVAERILDSGKADVAIIVDLVGGMVSLRSRATGPDCSVIAGLYGGGGHARAAGFKINTSNGNFVLKKILQEIFG